MPAEPDAAPVTEPEPPASLDLAAEFPVATRPEWRALAAKTLARSGGPDDPEQIEDALAYSTYDGVRVAPLYTADDAAELPGNGLAGEPPFVRGAHAEARSWDIRTRHADADPERMNAALLDDLEHGATSLWLVLGDGGLAVADLAAALEGVLLDLAPIVLELTGGASADEAEHALLTLGKQREVDPAALRGSLGLDPIGLRARTGAEADLDALAAAWSRRGEHPNLGIATVDGTAYHEAGASDGQELGIATAIGVAYLRALTGAGASVDEALAAIDFRWAVTGEQFVSIAKLRAARRVWDRVAELSGAAEDRRGQRQHAVTSAAMMTRRDPWVNMLRTTVACFAAAVGGADAITVHPFDAAIGVPDDFARRIARNTQSVLHDESSLARVVDAAGGSWFVESLTDELAEAAWTVFTDIEQNGGPLARLDDGTVEKFLAKTRAARDDDIAHRRAPITGVSEFAFVDEKPVERPVAARRPDGLLPQVRYAEAYEGLRDRSDAADRRPKIFLATLGPAAVHSARLGFARNLFSAAGLECVTGEAGDFAGAGTPVACLCSSDKVYADDAAATVEELRGAGAEYIWLAGQADIEGVDGQVVAGGDALDVLRTTLDKLGVR